MKKNIDLSFFYVLQVCCSWRETTFVKEHANSFCHCLGLGCFDTSGSGFLAVMNYTNEFWCLAENLACFLYLLGL